MQSTSWEMLGWKKHKLESKLPRETAITSDMQITPPLWQKVEKNYRASGWKWKRRVEKLASVSSVAQSCPTHCSPMNHSTLGLPIHHQLPKSTQTHVHGVGDAIKPSYPLSSPFPPALNLSQHQGLFQWVNSSHQVAKVLEFHLQQQFFQWTPRTDLL